MWGAEEDRRADSGFSSRWSSSLHGTETRRINERVGKKESRETVADLAERSLSVLAAQRSKAFFIFILFFYTTDHF